MQQMTQGGLCPVGGMRGMGVGFPGLPGHGLVALPGMEDCRSAGPAGAGPGAAAVPQAPRPAKPAKEAQGIRLASKPICVGGAEAACSSARPRGLAIDPIIITMLDKPAGAAS